jgi:hypothetical protein
MQPYAWTISDEPIQRLSTLIRGRLADGIPLTIEAENGLWKITTPVPHDDRYDACRSASGATENVAHIFCDPNRNCAAVEVAAANGSPPTVYRRLLIDLQQVSGAAWLPREIFDISLFGPPLAERYRLFDAQLNPTVAEDEFDIAFPVGTRVDDKIAGEVYVQGPDGTKRPWQCGCS